MNRALKALLMAGFLFGFANGAATAVLSIPEIANALPPDVELNLGGDSECDASAPDSIVCTGPQLQRVQRYTKAGDFVDGWPVAALGGTFLAVGQPDGSIIVRGGRIHGILHYDASGSFLGELDDEQPKNLYPQAPDQSLALEIAGRAILPLGFFPSVFLAMASLMPVIILDRRAKLKTADGPDAH